MFEGFKMFLGLSFGFAQGAVTFQKLKRNNFLKLLPWYLSGKKYTR
jgi:hypothetical protein